jgi:hypothetical protein
MPSYALINRMGRVTHSLSSRPNGDYPLDGLDLRLSIHDHLITPPNKSMYMIPMNCYLNDAIGSVRWIITSGGMVQAELVVEGPVVEDVLQLHEIIILKLGGEKVILPSIKMVLPRIMGRINRLKYLWTWFWNEPDLTVEVE